MFTANSRYAGLGTYTVTLDDGRTVTATNLPVSQRGPVLGYHPRIEGDRLDLLAARYLKDPTAFWRLCDANTSFSPDALAARPLIGIPPAGKT
ncbi:hypothetical protein [Novosphingobium lentum]|uniref:hypothetical protein n=1 Tax=Novosphingobium lentum TaxID=145287 RepID=UPI000836DA79|nr:hypothetical protein [Novosphingobium lentum]